MGIGAQKISFEKLLSKQLHCLSELSETFTLRLIDLEEKVAKLESNSAFKEKAPEDYENELLRESEERVKNLHSLLELDKNQKNELTSSLESHDFLEADSPDECQSEVIELYSGSEVSQQDFQDEQDCEDQIEEKAAIETEDFVDTEYIDDSETTLLSA